MSTTLFLNKRALQIKKIELEKMILEFNKDSKNEANTNLLQENDIKIKALKKKLKIPHEAHV